MQIKLETVVVKDKAGNDVTVNKEDAPKYAEYNKPKAKPKAKAKTKAKE